MLVVMVSRDVRLTMLRVVLGRESEHMLALVQHRTEETGLMMVVAPPLERLECLLEELLGVVLLVVELDAGLLEGLNRVAEAREVDVEGCRRGELLHPGANSS